MIKRHSFQYLEINKIYKKTIANLSMRRMTHLSILNHVHISKRFGPGKEVVARVGESTGKMLKENVAVMKEIMPVIPRSTALVPYDPQRAINSQLSSHVLDPKLAASYAAAAKATAPQNKQESNKFLSQPYAQDALNILQGKLPDLRNIDNFRSFIAHCIKNNNELSDDHLKEIFHFMKHNTNGDLCLLQNIASILIEYFKKYEPSFQEALQFLDLCKIIKYEYELPQKLKQDIALKISLEKSKKKNNDDKGKSYEMKQQDALKEMNDITIKMNALLSLHKDNPETIIKSSEINEWYAYIENRKSILELSEKEIEIYNELKSLFNQFAPREDVLLKNKKDNLAFLKKDSKLPEYLTEPNKDKCITIDDYKTEINYLQETLTLLQSNSQLSKNDLMLLAIKADATTVDDEGTSKIRQETYQTIIKNNPGILGIRRSTFKPDANDILEKIKKKDFCITKPQPLLENSILSVAHASHFNLVVVDKNLQVYVSIMIKTSSKDDGTILLDICQPTNDPDKQFKCSYGRITSSFMIMEEKNLNIDFESTFHFYGNNMKGEPIIDILVKALLDQKDVWSNNCYQYPYEADPNFIRMISILSCKEKLQQLERDFQILCDELNKLVNDKEAYREKMKELKNMKAQELKNKKATRYFSLLPEEFQNLKRFLKSFEEKLDDDDKRKKKRAHKKEMKALEEENREKKMKEQENSQIKTAKQKREEFLKNKNQQKDNSYNE